MHVLVVLGNRMNDDGSMTQLSQRRLQAAMRFVSAFNADKIILSGGVAKKPTAVRRRQCVSIWLTMALRKIN